MNQETQEIAQEVIKTIGNSPKVHGVIGSSLALLGGFWDSITSVGANELALYIGIAVALVSLHNQIVVAYRSHFPKKKSK